MRQPSALTSGFLRVVSSELCGWSRIWAAIKFHNALIMSRFFNFPVFVFLRYCRCGTNVALSLTWTKGM